MIIGLLSDTHDNIQAISEAVKIFNDRKVGLVLHAGDYVAPFTYNAYKGLKCPLVGVFGNVDGDRLLLRERFSSIGFKVEGDFEEVKVEGVKIALIHGLHSQIVDALALSGNYDVVVHGHTHMRRCDKMGKALIVNPGEACGYLYGIKSIALLDIATLKVEFIEL
ncbi:MAG: metallophosphoesterase [Candidatus Nezhaarchaeota archaeon]|nr:metallophosphoesterase [Candidatus Nezhaarchaeota archaeon]MCX8142471.1 metallophosphoesterase [Candidatus Nezhaarchaeota archaeon]MDW8050556.1 metallophosphoesterase [Nitrososphaerota archaeon]